MSQKTLITSFEILNDHKRKDPNGLSSADLKTWKRMRDEIEELLFHGQSGPGRWRWVPRSCSTGWSILPEPAQTPSAQRDIY